MGKVLQQYPGLAYLFIAAGFICMAGAGVYANHAYNSGYASGFAAGNHSGYESGLSTGRTDGYKLGIAEGVKQGRNQTLAAIEQGEPTVLFRVGYVNNRSIAYTYPAANFSYVCSLSKASEWQLGHWTYAYNGTTQCGVRHVDLTATWNDPQVRDASIQERANASQTTENTTAGQD